MTFLDNQSYIGQAEYGKNFWNMMRGNEACIDQLSKGRNFQTDTYAIPTDANNKFEKDIVRESLFRQFATSFNVYNAGYHILAKDCDDIAQFVPEGASIPIYEGIQDFTQMSVESWKLASFVRLNEKFVYDATFDIEKYLMRRFAKCFGKAETNAFINGSGEQMPTGILHASKGADVAVSTEAISYDDVITLFFSVEPEYRANGVWLMNDVTAMALRKLKDADGNYLWGDTSNCILGKPVIISQFMPSVEAGAKPIAFGDFSYYWVVIRSPITVRTIREKFILLNQIGYLAFEFIDGKLVRPDAIKVLQITE